ncbi:hypothetical protein M514_04849 [Trichuris suis]|uniref:Uncharacterized protein n=1 Tax=Trichuris suis TaxID=68888 RepID=A0A085NUJ3_9BILA|nr:hypothetical protein M513_04849 [Trichuris suis]KFD73139.1 hypothetical protein M514_04849 [Trichuris suis]
MSAESARSKGEVPVGRSEMSLLAEMQNDHVIWQRQDDDDDGSIKRTSHETTMMDAWRSHLPVFEASVLSGKVHP